MRICSVARRAGIPLALTLSAAVISHAAKPPEWPPFAHIESVPGWLRVTNDTPTFANGSNTALRGGTAIYEPTVSAMLPNIGAAVR